MLKYIKRSVGGKKPTKLKFSFKLRLQVRALVQQVIVFDCHSGIVVFQLSNITIHVKHKEIISLQPLLQMQVSFTLSSALMH